ncbi:MAG: cytochrome-c peroxidase [Sedimenticola sp.]
MFHNRLTKNILFSILCLLNTVAWSGESLVNEPILPIRPAQNLNPDKSALGDRLFHDPQLSADNTLSCSSCHRLDKGGDDALSLSPGARGTLGIINTPTIYNSSYNFRQFWDGRSANLVDQVRGPVHNPIEMASNWPQVISKLNRDKEYRQAFSQLYSDGITGLNIQNAIAEFERSLTTPNSRFDLWLVGDESALSEQEKHGYSLFKSYGCIACHQGTNVGGNMYHHMGAMGNYFSDRDGEVTAADLGRFNVTGDPEDRHLFKVPSLRLTALTSPYFHDGRTHSLEKAITIMARYQLGREMPKEDVEAIAVFIKSLAGQHPRLNP